MRLLRLPVLFALLLPTIAFAMWRTVSTEELIPQTDYAVVASLSKVKEWVQGEIDYGEGSLTISEVLTIQNPDTKTITLRWSNLSGLVCPRVVHSDTKGKQYIWLLQRSEDGSVTADYPGRTIVLSEKENVIKLLKKNKK